jgi:hypothetical protein
MQIFTRTEVLTNVKHCHPFGSPVCTGKRIAKARDIWKVEKPSKYRNIPWLITPSQQECCACTEQANRAGEPPVPRSTRSLLSHGERRAAKGAQLGDDQGRFRRLKRGGSRSLEKSQAGSEHIGMKGLQQANQNG